MVLVGLVIMEATDLVMVGGQAGSLVMNIAMGGGQDGGLVVRNHNIKRNGRNPIVKYFNDLWYVGVKKCVVFVFP
jgi:hypothetical protein